MIRLRAFVLLVPFVIAAATSLLAQDLSHYRDFALGTTAAAVTATSGVSPSDIKVIHQRPALIQELRWRPQRYGGAPAVADPVREVLFRFYEDKLFLVEVDYDRQRTEGLTDADLVESLARTYGPPVLTSTGLHSEGVPAEPGRDIVVAQWADADAAVTLLRGTYPTSLRLVLALTPIESLARSASAEAIVKDSEEAPQREVDRQKQLNEDRRLAGQKARGVNKPAFRP
jgi:hypothetical protein